MHFDLTDLRLFAAVVEEGSITAGASRAAISLPSASARVKGMEKALGTGLLENIAEACGRPPPALRSVTMLNSFWHKWSGYVAISANMRVEGCGDTSD
jgi:hypothetical protein